MDSLSCQQCNDGFYISDSNQCLLGAIDGCKKYLNRDVCMDCQ